MPKLVRRDAALAKRGATGRGRSQGDLELVSHPGTGQGAAKTIGQQRLLGFQSLFFEPRFEEAPGALAKGQNALLATFADEANGFALILGHVAGPQMDNLGNPRARIVEQLKEQTVSAASPAGRTRSLQDCLDLYLREETNQPALPPLSRNRQDALYLRRLGDRSKRQEIPSKGAQGAPPGIASAGFIMPLSCQVIQNSQHVGNCKVRQVQGGRRLAVSLLQESQEKAEGVSVRGHRGGTD